MSGLLRVKNWLMDTWKVPVPDEWLSACWEWIQQDQERDCIESFETQCGHVFDQWLLSDLRDIGTSCFPSGFTQQAKYYLQGIYVAQINSVVDISVPLYKQVQKLTGAENENANVDASTQQTQVVLNRMESSNEKHSRMLMMWLTDGLQDVKAIEINHIPSISSNISLGAKIIIHGTVLCRVGVLLLRAENVSVLGGEVEGMMEQFNPLKIVEDKLHSNINGPNQERGSSNNHQPAYDLPRKEFAGFTVLSNSKLSEACHSRSKDRCRSGAAKDSSDRPRGSGNNGSRGSDCEQFGDNSGGHVGLNKFRNSSGFVRGNDSQNLNPNNCGHPAASTPTSNHGEPPRVDPQRNELLFSDDDDDLNFENLPLTSLGGTAATNDNNSNRNNFQQQNVSHQSSRRYFTPTADDDDDDEEMMVIAASQCDSDYGATNLQNGTTSEALPEDHHHSPLQPASSSYQDTGNNKRLKLSSSSTTKTVTTTMTPEPILPCQRPFVYISNILRESKCGIYFIKAFVSTVIGKLEHNEGRAWTMKVKVNDGSSVLEVQLHDKVLTKLIGFSALECQEMKKKAKIDLFLREVVTRGIKQFQESLIKMSVIFELHVVPSPSLLSSSSLPSSSSSPNNNFSYIIVDYRKVTMDDVEIMKKITMGNSGLR